MVINWRETCATYTVKDEIYIYIYIYIFFQNHGNEIDENNEKFV